MSNPIKEAIRLTGWSECVVAYLYEEFTDETKDNPGSDDDFLEFLADEIATAAFVIAASGGAPVEVCLEAYAHGRDSILDEEFDVEEAMESIHLAELPDDDTAIFDEE